MLASILTSALSVTSLISAMAPSVKDLPSKSRNSVLSAPTSTGGRKPRIGDSGMTIEDQFKAILNRSSYTWKELSLLDLEAVAISREEAKELWKPMKLW